MKWIIWTIAGVLAALWTGALALLAGVVDWAGGALQQAGSVAPPAELPAWLARWVDADTWAAIVQAAQETLDAVLPAAATATGWLEPLVWIFWGFGMAALLVVAAGSHWFVTYLATHRSTAQGAAA
jgi:hypothetical protein